MKILHRHILKEFLKVLLITLTAFIALFLIVDVVENLDDFLENNVPLIICVQFFLYKIPAIFFQISPMAMLLAVLLSLGVLNKNNEITAIKAGGIGLLRALAPLFVCGIIMSICVIFINESITPMTNKAYDKLEARWMMKKNTVHLGSSGIWFRSGQSIVNIAKIDLTENKLSGINKYTLTRAFTVKERISAKTALWDGKTWVSPEAELWSFAQGRTTRKQIYKDYNFSQLKSPEKMLEVESSYEKMSFSELGRYIESLKRDGYDTAKYRVELLSKLSFPLVNLVMVLVGIPFALRTGRNSSIASGMALSFIIGFGYWIIFGMTKSLGQSAMIPPEVAAFFPIVVFLAIGALMFSFVRQ
jgi:lipopolysaccharide export system permease protein